MKTEIKKILDKHYQGSKFIFPPNNRFVFICGGNTTESVRPKLIKYLQKYYNEAFDYLLAEDLNKLVPEENDLLDQENHLADYADCIIIVLESFSSCVEFGAFVNFNNDLIKKMLIINKFEYKDEQSFINKGPIKQIIKYSNFKEILYYKENDTFLEIADKVVSILNSYLPKNRKSISFDKFNTIKNNPNYKKILLYFILDIVTLLTPIYNREIHNTIGHFIPSLKKKDVIEELIGVLSILKYIEKIGGSDDNPLYRSSLKADFFVKNKSYLRTRSKILDLYKKKDCLRFTKYYEINEYKLR